jgi:hypothetical protein
MQQEAKKIPVNSIVEYNGITWYIQKQMRTTTCLVSKEAYKEISNETLLVGVANTEQTAKHYLNSIK